MIDPEAEFPPITDVGETAMLPKPAGVIVRTAVCEFEPNVAETVACTRVETPDVVMVNVVDVRPAGMVTTAGTDALMLVDVRAIAVPPGPAGPPSVTVPMDDAPDSTDAGERLSPESEAGLIVKMPD